MHGVGVWFKRGMGGSILSHKVFRATGTSGSIPVLFPGWRRRFSLLCLVVQSAASSTSRGWWSPFSEERERKEGRAVVEVNGQM